MSRGRRGRVKKMKYMEREKGKDGAGEQKMRIRFRDDEE